MTISITITHSKEFVRADEKQVVGLLSPPHVVPIVHDERHVQAVGEDNFERLLVPRNGTAPSHMSQTKMS